MHKKFHFYLIIDLRYSAAGGIIFTVHGSIGSGIGFAGRLLRVSSAASKTDPGPDGRAASAKRTEGPASGAGPSSEGLPQGNGPHGPAATGRRGCYLPPCRFFLVRVSPQGHAGRSGASVRTFRVPGGSLRGQPRIGSSLPAERATSRRGTPGGDFRAGGDSGEVGVSQRPLGTERTATAVKHRLRQAPQPLRGRRSSRRVSPLSLGMR